MAWQSYAQLFKAATGNEPFPYQLRLAEAKSLAKVLNVPTGAGKTAAMVNAWIWRLFFHESDGVRKSTPRRLVYCLPMRVLVEQTRDNVKKMLLNLGLAQDVDLVVLMGGEVDRDWLLSPERPQVIIGTQDMLLSAALNRGYAMSRFRWPHAFGLLNNDCLWCFDEVQLMGSGLATSIQLDAFRKIFDCYGHSSSLWMSATLEPQWFTTPDSKGLLTQDVLSLCKEDLATDTLSRRMSAVKKLRQSDLNLADLKKKYSVDVAKSIVENHLAGTLTLAIFNQVERAQGVYRELQKLVGDIEVVLVHSRFRPIERQQINQTLLSPYGETGRIVISTQVVEAGVDISASTLFSELAPWSSMVQRFGRCNRYGELDLANVIWLDLDEKNALPYSEEDLSVSRKVLVKLEGRVVSPATLPKVDMPQGYNHIIRRKDIIELFDTSPDISGNDVDISRFIRDGEELDVSIFWRTWEGDKPPAELPLPHRDELCSVQVWTAKKFIENNEAWKWDHLGDGWLPVKPRDLRPGMVILLQAKQGGYSPELGWTGDKTNIPSVHSGTDITQDSTGADPNTIVGRWLTLAQHSDHVVGEMDRLISNLGYLNDVSDSLKMAARWHDAGKAHEVFQATMVSGTEMPPTEGIWAKTPVMFKKHKQPHFRHELASALAYIANLGESSLVAYLIAAHHGKIRLSIRSLPGEKLPLGVPADTRIARGVWEGSKIFTAELGGDHQVKETEVGLATMEMGEGSWLEQSLKLRDEFGPFKLAFLEAILRTADIVASIKEGEGERS